MESQVYQLFENHISAIQHIQKRNKTKRVTTETGCYITCSVMSWRSDRRRNEVVRWAAAWTMDNTIIGVWPAEISPVHC